MSDSVRPHRRQPTRLLRPWDSPGKNTGVGCHFLLQCMKVKSESEVALSCPTQQPHELQPTRLLWPWDFPDKSTGVGCHCLLRLASSKWEIRNHRSIPLLSFPNSLFCSIVDSYCLSDILWDEQVAMSLYSIRYIKPLYSLIIHHLIFAYPHSLLHCSSSQILVTLGLHSK